MVPLPLAAAGSELPRPRSRSEVVSAAATEVAARCRIDAATVMAALADVTGDAIEGEAAIPHARIVGIEDTVLVEFELPTPVAWRGEQQVRRCVVVISPKERPEEHLAGLAEAARRISAF